MLNKLKKALYADDFSYFIRYFGVFTLIFSAMTLIIIQVMRSSLYTTVDDNLKSLSQNPIGRRAGNTNSQRIRIQRTEIQSLCKLMISRLRNRVG